MLRIKALARNKIHNSGYTIRGLYKYRLNLIGGSDNYSLYLVNIHRGNQEKRFLKII